MAMQLIKGTQIIGRITQISAYDEKISVEVELEDVTKLTELINMNLNIQLKEN